jgi:DNA-binding NarL/FixJ family response regulator
VILADDHAIFRHGLRAVLELMGCIEIVAECGDGDAALAAYREHRPDVLLLDLRMPRLDGLEVVRRVLEADRAARILVMTTYSTDQDIGHALRAGAKGYLLKDAAAEDVCRAIVRVAEGGMFLAPDVARAVRPALDATGALAARAADPAHGRPGQAEQADRARSLGRSHDREGSRQVGVRKARRPQPDRGRGGGDAARNGLGRQLMYLEGRSEVQRSTEIRSRASRAPLNFNQRATLRQGLPRALARPGDRHAPRHGSQPPSLGIRAEIPPNVQDRFGVRISM